MKKEAGKATMARAMHGLDREQALELFKTLPAPAMSELDGEYGGHVHDGGDPAVRAAKHAFFYDSAVGYWLGKAYHPGNGRVGEGYNMFRQADGAVARFRRFETTIGPSRIDGRPSLIMRYAAFDNMAGRMDLVDEVRRLAEGAFLCVYTGDTDVPGFAHLPPGATRTLPELFGLSGPSGPWQGVDRPENEQRND